MKIVVDAQLPYAAERFQALGRVEALRADEMTQNALRDADALVVRSVTRVDAALLDGSRVRFVGSATAGTDHIDLAYLRRAGIAFADAAGANSTAVAEYVVAALLELQSQLRFLFPGASIGIIGCGHVGRRVARYAAALGLRVVINDPPLGRATCEPLYRPLEEAVACDIVSLHVPLERCGPDPTYHLVDATVLDAMKRGTVLINAARGAVVDSAAMKTKIRSRGIVAALDTWENEPRIDQELFQLAAIGTAHIAGHTLDAKRRAVDMVFDAAVRTIGDPTEEDCVTNRDSRLRGNDKFGGYGSAALPKHGNSPHCHSREGGNLPSSDGDRSFTEPLTRVEIPAGADVLAAVHLAIKSRFHIACEADHLRELMQGHAEDRAAGFDFLRSVHPTRREFSATEAIVDEGHSAAAALATLGFRVATRASLPAAAGARP